MKTKLLTLAALVALGLTGCGGAGTGGGSTDYHPYDAPPISDEQKKEFLDAVNEVRATGRSCGSEGWFDAAPALKWDDRLYRAAAEHSHDMAETSHYATDHSGSGKESDWTAQVLELGRGSTTTERILNNKMTLNKKYWHLGENAAAAYSETDVVMEKWLESDHHCANIMRKEFTLFGMAYADNNNSQWGRYWTQNYSTPE